MPHIRQIQKDYMEHRSGLILEGVREDYLPEEYLEDMIANDEGPNVYAASAFLRKYYDEEYVEAILDGLYNSIY